MSGVRDCKFCRESSAGIRLRLKGFVYDEGAIAEKPAPMPLEPPPSTQLSPVSIGQLDPWLTTIRPFGTYALEGLSFWEDALLAVDTVRGYLLQVTVTSGDTRILNAHQTASFLDATGLAVQGDKLWFTRGGSVYYCTLKDLTPQHFVTLPYQIDGVAVWQSTVYVSSQKLGYIVIFEAATARQITRFPTPGVGSEHMTVRDEELWVSDRIEQTVYCLDRGTGEVRFSVLTPFDQPTGLAFHRHPVTGQDILYVAYAGEEPYIRDNPNADPSHELAIRDRTFIHPLHFHYYEDDRYSLSNGYLVEMSYVEELQPLEEVDLENVEWRIALPAETNRQKVRQVEAIGMPFTEELHHGQRVALFKFDTLKPGERRLLGWKALLEVWSIKYQLAPREVENAPPLSPEFQARYLVDDDELAMDTATIRWAAQAAVGTETNLLRRVLKIRNYVYDRLSYGIKPHIDTPDVVLERGIGSCGEYVGLILALARLNGIACRTVGRYKCPPYAEHQFVPLEPDFNHVWIEFYIPGFGWLPMESNPDDVVDRGPYPTRFFMGLAWYHAEMAKGVSFENVKVQGMPLSEFSDISLGDLSINHIKFKILGELAPSA
uniref:transglutaminase domain-containing protein n=1 Tax=Trichocoleus desertorum TaxID=1481672 RepID=UPI0025B47E6D